MSKLLIIHTGGTIAMEENKESGAVSPGKENPLNATLTQLLTGDDVVIDDFINIPSPHMTPEMMFAIAERIENKIKEEPIQGIVITHGTDTLEETAYLLDLVLQTDLPVVVTGAMRSSNELGSDGPYNLLSSIKVALCQEAKGKGVLVVLNDEIHTAKNVTKTHTSNVSTFQSPQYGPIGIVTKQRVFFHHTLTVRDRYHISGLTKKVMLLKAYAGMDSKLLIAVAELGIDGIVIEALGQGNLPPDMMDGIKYLRAKGIAIVMVSRCFNGIVQDVYGYKGGGKHLKEHGVIFSNGLNGQKARLKLLVTLEATEDDRELHNFFLR
ncbi:asparaginase [Guptibacillus spartinae]|uniref:asparaginase n=1 Tax=Guptibacillus spartinae TaxID=3025679 RepID=UPI002362E423|nr:asparaginase [Pseudalkalibacillus spartinae]